MKIVFYAILGALLDNVGVHANHDWQFWAISGCVVIIDAISSVRN